MTSSLTYKDAGVDIEAGDALVERIKPIAKRTTRPGVVEGLGGFGALFSLPWQSYKNPLLVSGTDGVGTKLKLALELNQHQTIGIDLVAMCVNDIIVQGAEPLFFLDYYATSRLDLDVASTVIAGIGEGCLQAGCALIGGETAEMPGLYQAGDYDLAGFAVGIVERDALITGQRVEPGNAVIALASSGAHSNGYSLIRHILQESQQSLETPFENSTLGEILLRPTRIYVKTILSLIKQIDIRAIAHITGGGLVENIPRVLPENLQATLDTSTWQWPKLFKWLQEKGQVSNQEMWRTFNCGIGMVLIIPEREAENCLNILKLLGETAWKVGQIETKTSEQSVIFS